MIVLIRLDERPVNTRYPRQLAAIAGVELQLPPPEYLSRGRRPAPPELSGWLLDQAERTEGIIVSCEMLGYGGLMASRITDDSPAEVLQRLDVLRQLRQRAPTLPIFGFNLITRVSNANHNVEEPLYWGEFGARFYRYSQLLDQAAQGEAVASELGELEAELPLDYRRDFLQRRARNHTVNLAILQLLADGVFDLLVLSSDDTSPYGLGSREKRWLQEWVGHLDLGERLLMYPGADEVGCVLLARLINQQQGVVPRFRTLYAQPERAGLVAPYEDGPISLTIERQIAALGGELVEEEDALLLAVNPPDPSCFEFDAQAAAAAFAEREAGLRGLITAVATTDQPHALLDVAYPNGSDPYLVERLFQQLDRFDQLTAYAAWNTAGNTIGTALAHLVLAQRPLNSDQTAAQQQFLLHRLVEDWGYQRVVRQETRRWLAEISGVAELTPPFLEQTCAFVTERLTDCLAAIPGADGWRVTPGSVTFPWNRLFEVDFTLEVE